MKKIQLLFFIIILVTPVFAQESADMWIRLYERMDTLEHRFSVMQNIVNSEDRALIPLLQKALAETNIATTTNLSPADRRFHDEIQRIAIVKLGNFEVIESEDAVFAAFVNSTSLVVRTEAAVALGRMGSVKYINHFIIALRNLNMRADASASTSNQEAMAHALVAYFAYVKDIRSYEVLFYAAAGWYSPRLGIRENARNALPTVAEDPSEILKNIILNDPSFDDKILALYIANESPSIPEEQKSNLAVAGLDVADRHVPTNIVESMQFLNLRLLASNILATSSHKAPEAVPFFEIILLGNYGANEKLAAIAALATYRSSEAAETLVKFLRDQNIKQAEGLPNIDRRPVIASISALGEIGNPVAREELLITTTIQRWSTDVRQTAQAALTKLQG